MKTVNTSDAFPGFALSKKEVMVDLSKHVFDGKLTEYVLLWVDGDKKVRTSIDAESEDDAVEKFYKWHSEDVKILTIERCRLKEYDRRRKGCLY